MNIVKEKNLVTAHPCAKPLKKRWGKMASDIFSTAKAVELRHGDFYSVPREELIDLLCSQHQVDRAIAKNTVALIENLLEIFAVLIPSICKRVNGVLCLFLRNCWQSRAIRLKCGYLVTKYPARHWLTKSRVWIGARARPSAKAKSTLSKCSKSRPN